MTIEKTFYAHGKLLLSGEYFVLDGALALALPTIPGQKLSVNPSQKKGLHWKSLDREGNCWFEGLFSLPGLEISRQNDPLIAAKLQMILKAVGNQNAEYWTKSKGIDIVSQVGFPREWGLGTSSTLIANLAQWAGIDPFMLLDDTFGGSGYDIACAQAGGPIFFQRIDGHPNFVKIPFRPPFIKELYFIFLGKKQDSREGIRRYREKAANKEKLIRELSVLTARMFSATTLHAFEQLIARHEELVAASIQLPTAKSLYFSSFWGEVKSLGAWGGDFVLASSNRPESETKAYFFEKGFELVLTYDELIL